MIDNLEDDYNSVKAELSVRDNAIQSGDTEIKLQSADNASLLDDYNDIKAEQLNLSVLSAFKKNPEESAKIYSIAKAKNLPIDYVERNLEKVSRPDISSLPPAVADLMRDRQKAAISHDDIDNLSWWESSINELGNLGETGKAGLFSLSSAGYSLLGQAAKLNEVTFPGNVIGPLSEKLFDFNPVTQATDYMMGLSADQRVKAELSMPAPEETAMHPAVLGGVKSVVMNVPALAAGVAARSPTVALNAMMGNVYGDSYLTAKQSGLSEAESIIYSSNHAIAERAMEGISMFKLFEDMKLGTGFVKTIATQMALEIPTEQVTTIWQDAIDWAVLNPDKTVNEFMAERPDAAVNTLISTVVATGIQGSAMHGIGRLGRERDSDQLQAMADQANASLLNQRAPDIFAEFIQRASEEGGAPENVYIDAKEARVLMQSMSQDRAYNLISEQVADAEAVGGDIVIPVGEFASTVATSSNFEILKNSLRLSPEQLTESQREGQPERIASMLLEANKNVELKTRAVQIHNEITQQLIDTGRMNRDTAKASASIIPAYVVSISSRSGLSVDEVYGMMGLSIKGADSSSSSTSLEQKSLAEWDAMLRELDYSESKTTQSKNDETEFLSNAPAGTRHTDESPLLKRIRRSSDQAFDELGGSPEAGRVGKTRLGQFTGYRTQADIIEPDSIHPDGRLEVHVFGKEQDQQNLSEEPALTFVVSKNGELSVNGPTGETFQKFKEAGWAQDATGKGGEVQDGWTALTTKDGKPIPLSELSPLIADVHARVRAWRGEGKVGLHWSRSTGATGEVAGGRKTSVFFQSEPLPESIRKGAEMRTTKNSNGDYISNSTQSINDFWNYFRSSKVVDEKGAPLVVYSGTPADLTAKNFSFDYSRIGTNGRVEGAGFYFTANKKIASGYGNVISAYLSIQKPMPYDHAAFKNPIVKKIIKEIAKLESKASGQGIGDGFLSNFGDVNYEGLDSVINNAAELISKDSTALDQISGIVGSGVSPEFVNRAVESITGFDGVIAKGFENAGAESNMIYVAFFPEQVKSVENVGSFDPSNTNVFEQNTGENRGSFDPKSGILRLTQASDASTFFHEAGHLFLEMEAKLFNHPDATEQMKADGQVILDWLGISSFESLQDYETNPVSREAHEKFARGFELYIAEGKAPSIELKVVFRRFAAWMKQVYRDLININVELNDDVRAVMDRMLATDEQIARVANDFKPLFESAEDAGMTQAEFNAYTIESSPDSAKEDLMKKMMTQLKREYTKWWKDEALVVAGKVRKELIKTPLYSALAYMRSGGTTKEARALAADIENLEEQLRKLTKNNLTVKQAIARAGGINRKAAIDNGIDTEIVKSRFASKGKSLFPATGGLTFDGIAELLNQEGYSLDENGALNFVSDALSSDKFINQDVEAQAQNLASEISVKSAQLGGFGKNRLNRDDVDTHFFGDIPSKFIGLTSANGISADEMAAMHDFASGSELLDLINVSPSFSAKVKELTALTMQQKHGDILTDGTIREEAEKAVRGAAHAKMLIAELSALSRKTKTPAIDREAMKQYAKEVIGKMAFSKIRPAQYRSAEIRAAREAATLKAKGDLVGAQKAKAQELINFYLSREATATKEKADANRKYMQAILARKYNTNDVNPDYVTQMQALARLYDFRKNPQNQDSARVVLRSIGEWITAQSLVEESGYYPTVIDPILSLVNAAKINDKLGTIEIPSYRDMTAEEIQGVADQAKNLRYIGGLLSENAKNVLKLESEMVGESIRENGKGLAAAIPEEITRRDQRMSALREFGQDHIRLANQIEEMDGFKKFGPLFESLYQDIIDSTNKELKLKRHAFDNLRAALSGLKVTDLGQGKDEKTIMRESGETLTLSRRARIVFGLYWGSPEGREAIKLGHNMTDNDAQKMLDLLEDKDLDAIEGIWKTNEVHWPEVSRINQKLKGVTLPKVEHIPYESNGRKLPGGYLRLFYKYDKRDSVRDIKAEDLLMTRTGNRLARNTKNGSRNERVGSGGRKVSWDFNNVFVALDETIHDIAFAETASKASRFIRSNAVLSAISDVYGKEKYESILSSLSGIIAGNTSISHPISGFLQHFRVAQTYAFLGYSIRNLVQQPLAYFNVFGKAVTSFDGYGEVKVMAEVAKFAMSPKETIEFVQAKSEFIINRTSVVNAETAAVRQRFSYGTIAGGWWETYKNHAFATQTLGDMIVVYPAWMAAYNEGLKKFANEKKAVTFADEFVSSTVGSGLIKDMAPLLQGGGKVGQAIGSEQLKAITFMGSFFNVNLNLMTESFKRSEYLTMMGRKTVPSSADFYRQMMWYVTVPAIIGALIVGNGPDEEDENFFGWAAKEMAAYSLSSIFFIRDIVSMARGFGPSSSYSRAADAAKKLAEEGYKIYEDEKDVDAKTAGKILRASGMLFPIPGSGSGARALEEVGSDEEFNPYKALVTGANK